MLTNVYVDGFNLYYGIKKTPYRWLNIRRLAETFLGPGFEINKTRYFTARVKAQSQARRQDVYLRAIRSLPAVNIHYGNFHENKVIERPLAAPVQGLPKYVEVLTREEKGSDVNLGSYLLLDAFDEDYEMALVISNDSDLQTPIQLVRKRFRKQVIVAVPNRTAPCALPADNWGRITERHLKASQFPETMRDKAGKTITKPHKWAGPPINN